MAVYKGESPLQLSGDPQRDVVTLRNALYERDMQLRYVLEHLDGENMAEGYIESIMPEPVVFPEIPETDINMEEAIGILAVENGGTGANNKNNAARNLMERGSWTPKIGFLNGADFNVTYTKQYGTYLKVGDMVTVAWDMTFTASGNWLEATDYIHVVNLPYVPEMDRWCGVVGQLIVPGITYNSSGYACHARVSVNGIAHRTLSGAAVSVSSSNTGTFYLAGTLTYKVY